MKKWIALLLIAVLTVTAGLTAINMRFPVRHLDTVREHAGDLESSLILAVIMAESSFRPGVESRAGAQGLMQLMPATAEEIAMFMGMADFEPEDVWIPETNIAMGSFYLNRLYSMYGCVVLTLAAYNAGMGRVNGWLANPEMSADGQRLDDISVIPFPETYNYIRRVARNQRIYNIILTVTGRA